MRLREPAHKVVGEAALVVIDALEDVARVVGIFRAAEELQIAQAGVGGGGREPQQRAAGQFFAVQPPSVQEPPRQIGDGEQVRAKLDHGISVGLGDFGGSGGSAEQDTRLERLEAAGRARCACLPLAALAGLLAHQLDDVNQRFRRFHHANPPKNPSIRSQIHTLHVQT